jgi:hypothetical protein
MELLKPLTLVISQYFHLDNNNSRSVLVDSLKRTTSVLSRKFIGTSRWLVSVIPAQVGRESSFSLCSGFQPLRRFAPESTAMTSEYVNELDDTTLT